MLARLGVQVLICLAWCVGIAQAQSATVQGEIREVKYSLALPGANVLVVGQGQTYGAVSDSQGRFIINEIAPGHYRVEVSYVGYKTENIEDVQLLEGETRILNVELEPTDIQINPLTITASRRPENYSMHRPRSLPWKQEISSHALLLPQQNTSNPYLPLS